MVHIPRWQLVLVLALVLFGLVFAAPNLLRKETAESLPSYLPSKQISLGLDLQGGSYLLLEVDLDYVFEEQLENLIESVRLALREARVGYTNLGVREGAVAFELRETGRSDEVRELLREAAPGAQISVEGESTLRLAFSESDLRQRHNSVMQQSLEIVRRRIDELGTREPSIQRQGDERILVQVPGLDDPQRLKEILGQTAKLTFRLVEDGLIPGVDRVPPGAELLDQAETEEGGVSRRYIVQRRIMVSGENLVDAQPSFRDALPVVTFRFDTVGAKRFGDATQKNVGKPFAIVLDDKVISAPVIREPILGGSGEISGSFTVQETQDLALLLRAGALPAPITILEERTVGAGLGADSVAAGAVASLLGMIFVVAFMALSYGLFGVLADVALIINLVLIVAVLSTLQATLTLPGIAGIVLTIGMAVDANVLIFERIREEARGGRGPVMAIDAGYRRAMTTIVDSNLTTLIAALLLFQFGSGPVKGFAVTLAIGLVTSMFTAIMVTRLMVVGWLRRRRPQALPV